jgi:hypothetical protein
MEKILNIDELVFDSETNELTGKIDFNSGNLIDVTISIEGLDKDLVISLVKKTYQTIKVQEENYKIKTTEELIDLHNETWNEGKSISEKEFINRIKLTGILFFCEGNAELYYDDGDLFWGHTIVVDINQNGEYESAQICG